MIELTPEQLQSNWDKLIELIEETFEGERKEKLLEMYNHFEDRMMLAPASGPKKTLHSPLVSLAPASKPMATL